jgi:hypothetical protein
MSHTANAVDPATNSTAASLRIDASLVGYRELMRWAKQFPDRRWRSRTREVWAGISRGGSSLAVKSCSMFPRPRSDGADRRRRQ